MGSEMCIRDRPLTFPPNPGQLQKTRLQISSEGTSRVGGRSLTLASMCFLFYIDIVISEMVLVLLVIRG